ncbi:unnamed protein product [Rotaria socialis]|uniref:G domain-containing protein n=1 Tax=Rotaria socialis TaxID=392032 RepID=A0A818T3R6_9BILA|nr:unnamed protein product [Rotaria socialis]CAF4899951.1 unnamed protein product [Rotaria socialis]
MTSVVKRFIVLGDTGAGKSSFINAFYNYCYGTHDPDSAFNGSQNSVQIAIPCKYWEDRRTKILGEEKSTERDIEDQTKSQTLCCTTHTLEFSEREAQPHTFVIQLIDTPGFNDTEGVSKDDSNVYHIAKAVQDVAYLNGIIIVVNGSTSRLGTSFQHFMQLLHEVWPNDLMKNMCAVLTNCDDTTSNLKSEVLYDLLKVNRKTVFYMQNSLFRWDRKTGTSKTIRNLRRDFVESVETLKNLERVLLHFENVSTNAFVVGAIKQSYIQQCIHDTITSIIQMLQIDRQQYVVEESLGRARATMSANKTWEKEASITVTKWMQVEPPPSLFSFYNPHYGSSFQQPNSEKQQRKHGANQQNYRTNQHGNRANHYGHRANHYDHRANYYDHRANYYDHRANYYDHRANYYDHRANQHDNGGNQYGHAINHNTSFSYNDNVPRPASTYRAEEREIKVILEDNEAKSNHESARREVTDLRAKKTEFAGEHVIMEGTLQVLLTDLGNNVKEMRQINMGVDLLEKNKESLLKFRNEIDLRGDDKGMLEIYAEVVAILTKPIEIRSASSQPATY